MNFIKAVLLVLVLAIVAGALFVVSGLYHIGADEPHWDVTARAIDLLRNRSIETHAQGITVPDLSDPKSLSEGAEHYAAMCTGCHLAPGMKESELRAGLYPMAPNLSEHGVHDPAEAFWVIKHGVKLTAMPAWGKTHSDEAIWGLVAFVRKLPELSPEQYRQMVGEAGEHEHSHGGHAQGDAGSEPAHDKGDPAHHHDEGGTEPPSTHSHDHGSTPSDASGASASTAPPEPVAAVDAFFAALHRGDRAEAERWLDPEVRIFEAGEAEGSRDDYASHHMGEDMAFLKTARQTVIRRTGDAVGDLAWVASEQRFAKPDEPGPGSTASTETMVLKRTPDGWRIVHIHWSSSSS